MLTQGYIGTEIFAGTGFGPGFVSLCKRPYFDELARPRYIRDGPDKSTYP